MNDIYKNGSHDIPAPMQKRNEMIAAMVKAGIAYADIARQLNMTRQRVHQIAQREIAAREDAAA
jgi:DNA-binding NarL/FixJ family response regulator